MLSLIIPAKELDDYLFETVCKYKLSIKYDYEIIIVYDINNESQNNKFTNYFSNDKIRCYYH